MKLSEMKLSEMKLSDMKLSEMKLSDVTKFAFAFACENMYIMLCYLRMFVGLFFMYMKDIIVLPNIEKFKKVTFGETEIIDNGKKTMSVMSYNIHHGFSALFTYRLNEMIREIKKDRPDVLCLQEISTKEMYDYIKTSLGYEHGVYKHHSSIMTDVEIGDTSFVFFDQLRFYKKSCFIVADLTIEENDITVINCHLTSDMSLYKQEKEIEELQEYLMKKKLTEKKLVVAGDFNYQDLDICSYIRNNLSEKLRLEQQNFGCTFPSWMPFLHLDRIFYKNIVIKNHKKIESVNSDHYPVLAFFNF